MKGADVVAEILKREGTEFLACYPRNPLIDACAELDIRPILCRQERIGVGMADGFSRIRAGKQNGVFAAQHGPGIENAFAGVAQAYSENVPVLVIPAGFPRGTPVHHADIPRRRSLCAGDQIVGDGVLGAGTAACDAARLSGDAQRQTGSGAGRGAEPGVRGELRGHARLQAGAGDAQRARSGSGEGSSALAARGQAPGDLGGAGRALRRSGRAAGGAGRIDPGAGGRDQPGQERDRRKPSACRSAPRRGPARKCITSFSSAPISCSRSARA